MNLYTGIYCVSCTIICPQTSLDTEADHLPFGRPTLLISHNKTSVYIRGSPGHVTAYSTALLTPLWVSYTVGRGSGPSHGAGYPTCTLTGWERPQCRGVSFAQDNSRYVWTPLYRKRELVYKGKLPSSTLILARSN